MNSKEIEVLEALKEKLVNSLDKKRDKWFRKWMKEHNKDGVTEEYMLYMKKFDADNAEIWKTIGELDCTIRLNKSPELTDIRGCGGDIFPIKQFISMCESGGFIDSDGFGNYATKTQISDIEIYPSDVVKHKSIRTDFTHVVWFNK
jgi:hypothetical protein